MIIRSRGSSLGLSIARLGSAMAVRGRALRAAAGQPLVGYAPALWP